MNECPYPPSPKVIKAVSNEIQNANRYPDPEMEEELKRKIANYADVSVENIVVSNGSDNLIYMLMDVFIDKGDVVLILRPSFEVYRVVVTKNGGVVKPLRLKEPHFAIKLNELMEAAKGTKMLVIINPNNPTGNLLLTKEEAEELVANYEGIVVVDEAYYEFCGITLSDMVKKYPNIVVLRTFSKAFALAGLRIGYAIAHRDMIKLLKKVREPFPLSRLSIVAAVAALNDLDYVRRVVSLIKSERDRLYAELESMEGIRPYPSMTNFILFKSSVADLATRLAERKIYIRDFSVAIGKYYYRVSIGKPEENDLFLKSLREVVKP